MLLFDTSVFMALITFGEQIISEKTIENPSSFYHTTIDLSYFSSGIYLTVVSFDNNVRSVKILKN